MKQFSIGILIGAVLILILSAGAYLYTAKSELPDFSISLPFTESAEKKSKKETETRIEAAYERSKNIKGLYMTADVANDPGAGATRLRNHIIELADSTEINGIVIDVKEVCGPDYDPERLKTLIEELHKKNIWAIARIVISKDASEVDMHPEWYLKRSRGTNTGANECVNKSYLRVKRPDGTRSQAAFWRDRRGGYWLDLAHPEVQKHLVDFSKKMINLGFDELQFDYIRFPSDGDVENIVYPVFDGKKPKHAVMKEYFEYLHTNLKTHKPEIILSADLFGYAAIRAGDVGIGQRIEDVGNNFDYVSFMVYPSHYYSGLYLPKDPNRGFPAINYNVNQARSNPDVVIERSMAFARDFLDGKISSTTFNYLPIGPAVAQGATTTINEVLEPKSISNVRLRPWLEDFYHEADRIAGRPSGAEKVRLQIDAAQRVDNNGWLLWNAANVYTEGALKKE